MKYASETGIFGLFISGLGGMSGLKPFRKLRGSELKFAHRTKKGFVMGR